MTTTITINTGIPTSSKTSIEVKASKALWFLISLKDEKHIIERSKSANASDNMLKSQCGKNQKKILSMGKDFHIDIVLYKVENQRTLPPIKDANAMHLEEIKNEIETLVLEKGFYNRREDIPKKLLFAFIELGEASDAWKKGKNEEKIAEELVDVIFYVLDASRLACPSINMDAMFKKKLEKNKNREYQYGEGHRTKENIQQKTRDSSRSALIEAFSRDRNFRIGLKSQRPHGRRLVRERNKHID